MTAVKAVQLLRAGKTSKEIAKELQVSEEIVAEGEKELRGGKSGHGPESPKFSKQDALDLIDGSEGRNGLPPPAGSQGKQSVGHARDHIPVEGQDPKLLARMRPTKAHTTVYATERHALQDLRNVMNEYAEQLDALQKGGRLEVKKYSLPESRMGWDSELGKPPKQVWFNQISVAFENLPDGDIHLMHFSPQLIKPVP